MLSFYAFISFHIKCSKAHWHSRMRLRSESLLQVLNRAKMEPFVPLQKKTASGRTFVRKVGRCRLTVSNSVWKAPSVIALETKM